MTEPADYVSLTEIAGDDVTSEQVERLARRYYWAASYCGGKDVLEVACGTGQGVGYLASVARSMTAGDYSGALLGIARRHYGTRFDLKEFDAQQMPFADAAFDVVVIFEASYYIPDLDRFFAEARRVLRPGGTLLIATANKDLFDFNPSPHSHRYLGVVEFKRELARHGFSTTFFGDTPVAEVSARQQLLRPVKAAAAKMGLIPKSMKGKKLLKRLVFGGLVKMPAELTAQTAPPVAPAGLADDRPDTTHKVLYCAARLDPDQRTMRSTSDA
jgi:SAM-dependent methyltransferase